MKINMAIGGGSCTGKSTLAVALFSKVKIMGLDYDLIFEESRKLKKEFGGYRSPFDRFYMWRQQEREELRSCASDGFIIDWPLFHLYVSAKQNATEPRDMLAVRELFRMCLEQLSNRYQLIVIAENLCEIPYKKDRSRRAGRKRSVEKHNLIRSFVEHFWPEKLLLVHGSLEERLAQVIRKLKTMRRK